MGELSSDSASLAVKALRAYEMAMKEVLFRSADEDERSDLINDIMFIEEVENDLRHLIESDLKNTNGMQM